MPRKSTAVDMTAMCDVAFLLLTFFILTTKFKPQEAVEIDIPPATAQIPLPDKDILKFEVGKDGKTYMSLDDQFTRGKLLDRISSEYKIPFNEDQKKAFRLQESWGMDVNQLPQFLSLDANARAKFVQPGLKFDSTGVDPQVENLLLWSRQANNGLRIAIKGDKQTEYRAFDRLVKAFQNRKVNKFNIITAAKGGGGNAEPGKE